MRRNTGSDDPTGVAVVGCGYWGINYVRVLSELPDGQPLVVCDRDEKRLDEVRRRFPSLAVTQDLATALATPGVEAAVVATGAQTHFDVARQCLESDKHVLVEKPLTTESRDASALIALAGERERVLLVGHTFIYNSGLRVVKEHMLRADLGEVYYLYSQRTNLGPIRGDVNALWDLASHDVAIFEFLLDQTPEWVSAVATNVLRSEHEDVGFITLGYPGGIVAHVHASWADPSKVREVVVVGSDRRIVFNDLDPVECVRVFDKGVRATGTANGGNGFGDYHFLVRDGAIHSPVVPVLEPLKSQSGHFLHCVRRGEPPVTGGELGRNVVRVMEAVDRSIAGNGAPATVARDDDGVASNGHAAISEELDGARTVR